MTICPISLQYQMFLKLYLIIICLLTVSVYSWKNRQIRSNISDDKHQFTEVLALRWLGGFCYYLQKKLGLTCKKQQLERWDSVSFLIRGLWPSSKSTNKEKYQNYNFLYVAQYTSVLDKMNNYWPELCNSQELSTLQQICESSSWKDLYNNYGKDFANILQIIIPDKYSHNQQKLQQAYFNQILMFYDWRFTEGRNLIKSSILHPQPQFLLEKRELSTLLNLKEDQFVIKCVDGGSILYQLYICLKQDQDGIFPISCSKVELQSKNMLKDNCETMIEMHMYGINGVQGHSRVYKYPPPPTTDHTHSVPISKNPNSTSQSKLEEL